MEDPVVRKHGQNGWKTDKWTSTQYRLLSFRSFLSEDVGFEIVFVFSPAPWKLPNLPSFFVLLPSSVCQQTWLCSSASFIFRKYLANFISSGDMSISMEKNSSNVLSCHHVLSFFKALCRIEHVLIWILVAVWVDVPQGHIDDYICMNSGEITLSSAGWNWQPVRWPLWEVYYFIFNLDFSV